MLNLVGTLGFRTALSGNTWKTVMYYPFRLYLFWVIQLRVSLHCILLVTSISLWPLMVSTSL